MICDKLLWFGLNQPNLEIKDADVAIYGVPFEDAVSYRRGTKFGPDVIRSVQTVYPMTRNGVNLRSLKVIDTGDIDIIKRDIEATHDNVRKRAKEILLEGTLPLMIGGDHSLTYPAVESFKTKFDSIGVIWIDAHADLFEHYDGSHLSHACPLRRIIESGTVHPEHVIIIGARMIHEAEFEYLRKKDLLTFFADDFENKKISEIASKICDRLSGVPTYVSFDIDGIDPGFAPGTGIPSPGGLTPREVFALVHEFIHLDLVGFDVVEVNQFDYQKVTSLIAMQFICEMFGNIIQQRGIL